MSFLVFNITGAPITIAGTTTIVPASPNPPSLSKPYDVTSELRPNLTVDPVNGHVGGLSAANYSTISAQSLIFKWTDNSEYLTPGLLVGGTAKPVDMSLLATSGTGTISDPWVGWDVALNALTSYDGWAPAGHYEINVRVDVPLYSTIKGAGGNLSIFTTAPAYVGGAFRVAGPLNGSTAGFQLLSDFGIANGGLFGNPHSVGLEITAISLLSCYRLIISNFWCNCASDQGEIIHLVECSFENAIGFTTDALPVRSPSATPQGAPGITAYAAYVVAIYPAGSSVSSGCSTPTGPAVLTGIDFVRVAWTAPAANVANTLVPIPLPPTSYDIYIRTTSGWVGKVGSVAAGTLQFDYTGQAGNGVQPPRPQRNLWIVNNDELNVGSSPGFSNVTNIIRCNFNEGTAISQLGAGPYHIVHDGGNGAVVQACQFNSGSGTVAIRCADCFPITIDDNYAEPGRWLELMQVFLDTNVLSGANVVHHHGNIVSNQLLAAVLVSSNSSLYSSGNFFGGTAANEGGFAIKTGGELGFFDGHDFWQSAYYTDFPGLYTGAISSGMGFGVTAVKQTLETGYAWGTRPTTMAAADGTNNDLQIGTDVIGGYWKCPADVVITSGPTAAFTISGFKIDGGGSGNGLLQSAGMRVRVLNKTIYPLSFTNEGGGSTAAYRILTPTGQTVTISAGGWASFTYDAVVSRYRIDNTSLTLTTSSGAVLGLAAAGTSTEAAHADHVHPPDGSQAATALTDAATVTVNCNNQHGLLTLTTTAGVGATRKIGNPTNAAIGWYYFQVTADAVALRDVTWDTNYIATSGSLPHMCGIASAIDLFVGFWNGSKMIVALAAADAR
jgi:hypothetical protein